MTINLTELLNIAYSGIRRSAIFLGLGVNAMNNQQFQDYELTDIAIIQFIAPNAQGGTILEYKNEFKAWIVECGLRELIETFVYYLDQIHDSCLMMAVSKNKESRTGAQKRHQNFIRKMGIKSKIQILHKNFDIDTNKKEYLDSITCIRNCLTHRRGIVEEKDCIVNTEALLSWIGVNVFLEQKDQERILLPFPIPKDGIFVKHGGNVIFEQIEKTRRFKLGERIILNPIELTEMCFTVFLASQDIYHATLRYGEMIGIPVNIISNEK